MTEGDVNLAHPHAAGVGRCCPCKPQRRTGALLPDHFDLPERQPADPAGAECLEEGLLGRESGGQRLRPVCSLRALGPLGGRVDPLLEAVAVRGERSEEHTSELQSLAYLVCRLLLEKKKKKRM